jgi:hypothetical protein
MSDTGDPTVFGPPESAMSGSELAQVAVPDRPRRQREYLVRDGWKTSQLGLTRTICRPVVKERDDGDGDPWRFIKGGGSE